MDSNFNKIRAEVYDRCNFEISNYSIESESQEYAASRFELNGRKIRYRNAKVTPKKIGQFVTYWKRNSNGITEPLQETDEIDFYVITACFNNQFGQFVFPKSILIKKGIISSETKQGKRGFRVYPIWDKVTSKQAKKTQDWQLKYFYLCNEHTDLKEVNKLFCAR